MEKIIGSNVFFELQQFILTFSCGGVIYFAIEILYRGHSHWSMAITGGICFWLIYLLGRSFPNIPMLALCILGGAIITATELLVGELVNNVMKLGVWDYSSLPLNFRGQICLLFSLFWCIISFPANLLAKFLRVAVFGFSI